MNQDPIDRSGDDRTRIDLEIEVPGTPEEVWEAIATGPGITSWYVPHTVEEREGGAASARFGDGDEMVVPGRVAAWEPPKRIVFDSGEDQPGLAFEWLVEARDGGSCSVRLVNSGFGQGGPWDEMYDGMQLGWRMFLFNLWLHRTHFAGRHASVMLPSGMWSGSRDRAWTTLADGLGLPLPAEIGTEVRLGGGDVPELAGTVVATTPHRVSLLVDRPAPGTAFLAAEGDGDTIAVSVWAYLYGEQGAEAVERDQPRWQAWLADQA